MPATTDPFPPADPGARDHPARTWRPSNRDELERALSEAAMDAGLEAPDAAWCEFLRLAGDILIGRERPPKPCRPRM